MRSFTESYFNKFVLPPEMIRQIAALAEFKGKERLYEKQSPDALKHLVETAMIESAESSNRIEGIVVPHERVEALMHKREPRNRPEQDVAGYRDALSRIHEMYDAMPLSKNLILMLHETVYKYTDEKAGGWKRSDNEIIERSPDGKIKIRFKPVSALRTPETMEELVKEYHHFEKKYELLVLIPHFVLDFLCVHPFRDGNGRVARLLTLLLLYQAGFRVGKYISLERLVEQSKKTYYETLHTSSQGWHEGRHNSLPWLRYFYGVLTAAYKEFENRVGVFEGDKSKTERIIHKIENFAGTFSVGDLRSLCPDASIDLVRKVLKDLSKAHWVKPTSRGRYARWTLIK